MGAFEDYWSDNWPALVPALTFFILNPWSIWAFVRTAGAGRERLKLASDELVDQVEAALTAGSGVSRRTIFRLSGAIADRRQVKAGDMPLVVVALKQVIWRLQRNPALNEQQREQLCNKVDALIVEVKRTDGVATLTQLLDIFESGQSGYKIQREAGRVAAKLCDYETHDDRAQLRRLSELAESWSTISTEQKEIAKELTRTLHTSWAQAE